MNQLISMLVLCLAAALSWGCGGAQQDETTPGDVDEVDSAATMPEGETAPDEGASDPETTEEVIETSSPM